MYQEMAMNAKVFSFIFKVTKVVLIFLVLGLAVHFGLVAPRGDFSLDHSGVFGSSSLRVAVATLILYLLYRLSMGIVKTHLDKQEGTNKKVSKRTAQYFEKDDPFMKELTMLTFFAIPIATGVALSRSTVDLLSSIRFHVLRFVMFWIILASVWIIAKEDVEFSKLK